jgi:hypothetical protein
MKKIKYLIHSNKYGWVIRLSSWTGPKLMSFVTREEAIRVALEGMRGVDWALEPASMEEILVST